MARHTHSHASGLCVRGANSVQLEVVLNPRHDSPKARSLPRDRHLNLPLKRQSVPHIARLAENAFMFLKRGYKNNTHGEKIGKNKDVPVFVAVIG